MLKRLIALVLLELGACCVMAQTPQQISDCKDKYDQVDAQVTVAYWQLPADRKDKADKLLLSLSEASLVLENYPAKSYPLFCDASSLERLREIQSALAALDGASWKITDAKGRLNLSTESFLEGLRNADSGGRALPFTFWTTAPNANLGRSDGRK